MAICCAEMSAALAAASSDTRGAASVATWSAVSRMWYKKSPSEGIADALPAKGSGALGLGSTPHFIKKVVTSMRCHSAVIAARSSTPRPDIRAHATRALPATCVRRLRSGGTIPPIAVCAS